MTFGKVGCVVSVVAFIGAACHTAPPAVSPSRATAAPAPTAPARPPAPPARAAAPRAPAPLSEAEIFARQSLDELNAQHPLGDAFFDYDQSTLRADAMQQLQKDASWLSKWPQTKVRVDGHCDERGTAEYNLSLGERRAAVVRDYLVSLGVSASRIETRSLGKEAPFCQGAGTSW
jgi:peptidoglycan-associated lipoprotein